MASDRRRPSPRARLRRGGAAARHRAREGHQDHDHAGSQPGNPRGHVDRVQGRHPRRHGHRLTRGAMPWEGRGTRIITRRHASPCAWQCWRSSPIRPSAPGAEHHARWQAGLKSAPAAVTLRPHHRKPRERGRKLYPHPPCRIRAGDSSKCRSRWWRSDQPVRRGIDGHAHRVSQRTERIRRDCALAQVE